MKVDLHVHTNYSDGKNSPVEMIAAAKRAGLGAIAITDHDTIEGWKNLKLTSSDFLVIPGVELSSDKGHVLLIGIKNLPPTKILDEVLEWAKDNNVFAAASHVYDIPLRHPIGALAFEKFKVVEAINGKGFRRLCKKAVSDALKHNIKFLCNSDSHSIKGLGEFYNLVEGETVDEIIENLLQGNFEPRLKFPTALDFVKKRLF